MCHRVFQLMENIMNTNAYSLLYTLHMLRQIKRYKRCYTQFYYTCKFKRLREVIVCVFTRKLTQKMSGDVCRACYVEYVFGYIVNGSQSKTIAPEDTTCVNTSMLYTTRVQANEVKTYAGCIC